MQLAAWLDVALEGGVTELQRGLGTYRELRGLLEGEWKVRAGAVADLTARARARCLSVEAALERAQRRARQDTSATPVVGLAQRVEKERDALLARVAELHGQTAPVASQLDWLHATAREEAWFESSVRRFHIERAAFTSLLPVLGLAVPWGAWENASAGGRIGTVLALEGLRAPIIWVLIGALLLAVLAGWVRTLQWSWLGVRPPVLLSPSVLGVFAGISAASFIASASTHSPVPGLATMLLITLVSAGLVFHALWRPRGAAVN